MTVNEMSMIYQNYSTDIGEFLKKRKRYSQFKQNFAKNYVVSRLKEIKLYGSRKAEELIENLCKNDENGFLTDQMRKNKQFFVGLMCDIAQKYDPASVAGFFVPMIYGGVISAKNLTGEFVGMIKNGELSQFAVYSALNRLRSRGISVVVIRGVAEDLFSSQMCRIYNENGDISFILIEESSKREVSYGESMYGREILSRFSSLKNIFVLADGGEAGRDILPRVRALESYKLPCGILTDDISTVELSKLSLSTLIFSRENSTFSYFHSKNAQKLTFPLCLPDVLDILTLAQYILSQGRVSSIGT